MVTQFGYTSEWPSEALICEKIIRLPSAGPPAAKSSSKTRSWRRILQPDFTWPCPVRDVISSTTPPIPRLSSPFVQRFWGIIHEWLAVFSDWYWPHRDGFNGSTYQLPFGLIMKWGDRITISEIVAMKMTRAAGMPVPKVICYGSHAENSYGNGRLSILMTRLPGEMLATAITRKGIKQDTPLEEMRELLKSTDNVPQFPPEGPWLEQLSRCLTAMRKWKIPEGKYKVCSPVGGPIKSFRVPGSLMGPFESVKDMNEYLFGATVYSKVPKELFDKELRCAEKLKNRNYRTVFSHGDFQVHNILLEDGNSLSGFIDWECAGWYPEYWDFTTSMNHSPRSRWYQAIASIGGNRYLQELKPDKSLRGLTFHSISMGRNWKRHIKKEWESKIF